ncbi:MAG: isoprenylcysteine carboxylmethyltransferase family protein [Verrucomicrobia bacterium]|nr:isoprenylcysteine carboxylmethyltransferase family protein [Verrucomicrobiota bacterium]
MFIRAIAMGGDGGANRDALELMVNLFKTLLFTILAPGTLTVIVPWLLLPPGSRRMHGELADVVGLIAIVFGAAIYFWCAWDFAFAGKGTPAPYDPPKLLVTQGLYRLVRNPIYVGLMFVLLGEALMFASPTLLVYAPGMWLAFHLRIILYEERVLKKQFGEEYLEYCRKVPRWIPRWPDRNSE